MAQHIDLDKDPIRQSFFRYLLPAIYGLLVKSIFIIVDSIFVGRGVGPMGLAALSLTIPFFTIFTAIAMMVGVGGAAMMSVQFGKGRTDEGQRIFSQSMVFITLLNTLLLAIALYWLEEIIGLLGASGELARLSVEYMEVILMFFVVYAPAWVLSSFVRNDTNPSLAMYAMMAGAIANIILDYLFIFEFGWGIQGAAIATGISQALIFIILLGHFLKPHRQLKASIGTLRFDTIPKVLKSGLPIFFIESAVAASIITFNIILLRHYSELHVTAYGIVANLGVVALFMMIGIGQACQPIISFNYGAQKMARVKETLFLGLKYAIGTGLLSSFFVIAFAEQIASLFTKDDQALIELATTAIQIYFWVPVFIGLNMIIATLFQAIEMPNKATLISVARGFVFVIVGLLLLPLYFPEKGVWGSVLFAEALTSMLSLYLLHQFLQQITRSTQFQRYM